jgi:spore germination protein GerM
MTWRRLLLAAGFTMAAALLTSLMFIGLPPWYGRPPTMNRAAPDTIPAEPGRKINVRLFYVSDDGTRLMTVERDVAYAEQTVDQAREIIAAQIAPVTEPLVSAIPPGTTLRAVFVTSRGEAFVDLSAEVASEHPGGSMNELLTIYTIVHAVTFNLPAVSAVQLLVNGKEVDTLVGHVDLRQPLAKNLAWLDNTVPAPPGMANPEPEPLAEPRTKN